MVFDEARKRAILFGGDGNNYGLNDTWAFDLQKIAWTNLTPSGAIPPKTNHAMAYDSAKDRVLIFGGGWATLSGDTWCYDPQANTWSNQNPPSAPSARKGTGLAFDKKAGEFVLFGGSDGYSIYMNDTWKYNLTTNRWTNMKPSFSPSPRGYLGLVYDEFQGKVVLVGGSYYSTSYQETWTYSLATNTWEKLSTNKGPSGDINCNLVYNTNHNEVITQHARTIWIFNSSAQDWQQKNPTTNILSGGGRMVYDSRFDVVVLFTGWDYPGTTWAFNYTSLFERGNYTSSMQDIGRAAYFGELRWNATVPANTTVRLRLRTADSLSALENAPFLGPGGSNATFYNRTGQRISSIHNGSRCFQWAVWLDSPRGRETPEVRSVSVDYNLLHNVTLVSPAGNENWTGVQTISWTASDSDGDRLVFDLLLSNASGNTTLITGLSNETRSWDWDTASIPNGKYRVTVVARDNNSAIPLTRSATRQNFTIYHPPHVNSPPRVELASPGDGDTVTSDNVTLSWLGVDADSDSINYSVHLSTDFIDDYYPPDPIAATNETSWVATGLSDGQLYYWTVTPNDGTENGATPAAFRFRVKLPPVNHPPRLGLVSPEDSATVANTSVELVWEGSDPDGDRVGYRLFLASAPFDIDRLPEPAGFTYNTSERLFDLVNGTTYHWTVVATDGKLDSGPAPSRAFKIDLSFGNRPPVITSQPPTNVSLGDAYSYAIYVSDPDGDPLSVVLASAPAGMALDGASRTVRWTPSASQLGNHNVRLSVSDGRGGLAEQAFTVAVLQKPKPYVKPACSILAPANGTLVSGKVTLTGTARNGSAPIRMVSARIEGGRWVEAAGTSKWSVELDLAGLPDGPRNVTARASDGQNYSDQSTIQIIIKQPKKPAPSKGFIPGFEAVQALIAAALLAGSVQRARSRRHAHGVPGAPGPRLPRPQ
jgi:hypothetical protein